MYISTLQTKTSLGALCTMHMRCICSMRRAVKKCRPFYSAYESVAAALVGLSVCDDDRFVDVAELLEVLPQAVVGRVVRQTADEDLGQGRVDRFHASGGTLTTRWQPLIVRRRSTTSVVFCSRTGAGRRLRQRRNDSAGWIGRARLHRRRWSATLSTRAGHSNGAAVTRWTRRTELRIARTTHSTRCSSAHLPLSVDASPLLGRVRSSRRPSVWLTDRCAVPSVCFPQSRTPTEDATWCHGASVELAAVDRGAAVWSRRWQLPTGNKSKRGARAVSQSTAVVARGRGSGKRRISANIKQREPAARSTLSSFRIYNWLVFVTNGHAHRTGFECCCRTPQRKCFRPVKTSGLWRFSVSAEASTFCCGSNVNAALKLDLSES